ncbi:hypothetical protein C9I57_11960 [Trinickia symbiotica]|uniref:DUF4148 domain-containing protein n=1 Tax=Trinickia symbiotica TaxID=863227 RepID=A0A2T3XVM0_9BURK|nr:hypothetical protein [Trinickia symbiotica]PTB20547.1 hypothetical protein C9I57_11960 [Trinickia symbiotica]
MRLISAALLGAAAILPALAHAETTLPDPTDPAASVPTITVPSAFADYQRYRDEDGPGWKQLNRAVNEAPANGGMQQHDAMSAKPTDNTHAHHAVHGEAPK